MHKKPTNEKVSVCFTIHMRKSDRLTHRVFDVQATTDEVAAAEV